MISSSVYNRTAIISTTSRPWQGWGDYSFKRPLTIIVLLALFLLNGCSRPAPTINEQLYVFGTLVDVTVRGVPKDKAHQAITAVSQEFQWMHRDWHAWRPGALTELNTAIAQGQPHTTPESILPLIERSRELYHQSNGLFNPAIGGLIGLWGFHSDDLPSGPPPSKESIADWVSQNPGMDDLSIEGKLVSSRNKAVQLDFGGFAKGYAIDIAIDTLREFGIQNAIVNAGGDLRAIGRAGGRPWRIGIRHPQGRGVIAALDVEGDESVFTSGNYERYHEHDGVRYPHIIDPRNGMPVRHVASATVIHTIGAVADAAATALVVAGPKEWQQIAKQMGLTEVMLVDEEGVVYMTPAMQKRLEFEEKPDKVVIGTL